MWGIRSETPEAYDRFGAFTGPFAAEGDIAAEQPGKFPGLLDYWLTWVLATLCTVLLLVGLRKKVSAPGGDEPEAIKE